MPEAVTLSGAFIGPGTWRSVPAKSTVSVSPRLFTRMRILNGRSSLSPVVEDAVAVAEVLEGGGAVGQRGQHAAHHALGVVHHLLHDREQPRHAVLARQLLQARHPAVVGGELGAQVAAPLVGRAHVGEDDRLHLAVGHAGRVQPHRRQPQPLTEDLGGGAVGAGRSAADVRPVRPHAGEAEQRALVEGRA